MTSKATMYAMSFNDYFPAGSMAQITDKLDSLTDEQFNYVYAASLHNPTTILLISIFLGSLGVDRFMLGDIGLGLGKILTGGGCGIWWIIDIFMISDRARQKNYATLMNLLNYVTSHSETHKNPYTN